MRCYVGQQKQSEKKSFRLLFQLLQLRVKWIWKHFVATWQSPIWLTEMYMGWKYQNFRSPTNICTLQGVYSLAIWWIRFCLKIRKLLNKNLIRTPSQTNLSKIKPWSAPWLPTTVHCWAISKIKQCQVRLASI
jgi:hypothetical protein